MIDIIIPTYGRPHRVAEVAADIAAATTVEHRVLFVIEADDLATDDDVNYLEAQLRLAGHDIDFHRYPGTGHWFAEADRPAAYHAAAADLAWERTLAFLHARLDPPG